MKILLTGGATGGHFYPIIAVAEELNAIARENKLADLELYFMSPTPYNPGLLFNNKIIYRKNYAGKLRRYFSLMNFFDLFKTLYGVVMSTWELFTIYPDVVFGKGGFASFPALLAARILRIPVVIHESDSVPGRVNRWAGKFARKVAISYPEAAQYFNSESIALTGNPIRKDLLTPLTSNAHEFLHLDPNIPTILILGGSLGAQIINDAVTEALSKLLEHYQIVHQTGRAHIEDTKKIAEAVLYKSAHKDRYHAYDYMDSLTLRSAAGAANIVISRAGSAIFEIAAWGIPSIIIPISDSNGNHQRNNAYSYARSGAAAVIEEANLTGNILIAEIDRVLTNPEITKVMRESAQSFVKPNASRLIAEEIMKIALNHQIDGK